MKIYTIKQIWIRTILIQNFHCIDDIETCMHDWSHQRVHHRLILNNCFLFDLIIRRHECIFINEIHENENEFAIEHVKSMQHFFQLNCLSKNYNRFFDVDVNFDFQIMRNFFQIHHTKSRLQFVLQLLQFWSIFFENKKIFDVYRYKHIIRNKNFMIWICSFKSHFLQKILQDLISYTRELFQII